MTRSPSQLANASDSHRWSHHAGVTESPNHWCASSWAATGMKSRAAESAIAASNVMSPGFSIAPKNSGTATRSSLASGSGAPT